MNVLTRTKRAAALLIANAEQYSMEIKRTCNHYKFTTEVLERIGIRTVFEMDALQRELNNLGWTMEAITMHEFALQKISYLQTYVGLDSSRVDCLSDEALLDIVNTQAFRDFCYNFSRLDGWGSLCAEKEGSKYIYSHRFHIAVELYNFDYMSSQVSLKLRYGKSSKEVNDFVFFDVQQVSTHVSELVDEDPGTNAAHDDCFYLVKDFFKACCEGDDRFHEAHSFNSDRVYNNNRYGVLKYNSKVAGLGVILSVRVAFFDDVDKCYITDIYVSGKYVRTTFTRVHPGEDFVTDLVGNIEYLVNKFNYPQSQG